MIRDSELCFNIPYETLSGLKVMFSIVFCTFWLTSYVLKYLTGKTSSNKMLRSFFNIEEVSEEIPSADNIETEVNIL